MKLLHSVMLLGLLLCSCEPIRRGPGGGTGTQGPGAGVMRPGNFVRTTIDNAFFYRHRPLQAGSADLLLQLHTPMRLIQTDPEYSKVELDNGLVGFVPTMTLELAPMELSPDRPVVPDPTPRPGPVNPVTPIPSGSDSALPPGLDSALPPGLDPTHPPRLDPSAVPLPPG